jgi:hypothetical protein
LSQGSNVLSCLGPFGLPLAFDEHISVAGSFGINSNAQGAIALGGGNLSLEATGGIYTKANPPSSALNDSPVLGSITVQSKNGSGAGAVTAAPTGQSLSDPYAALTPPSVPVLTGLGPPITATQNISASTTLPSGDYTGAVNITNPGGSPITVTLNPGEFSSLSTSGNNINVILNPGPVNPNGVGNYIFTGPVSFGKPFGTGSLSTGGNITLSPGDYAQGLHIVGANLNVTLNSGEYTFGQDNVSNDPSNGDAVDDTGVHDTISGTSGVLAYVSSGSINLIGFGQSLSLDPMSPPASGLPAGLALWQSASDSDALNVLGIGVGVSIVGGTIYAPSAVVGSLSDAFGGDNSYSVGSLIAGGLVCPGWFFQLTIGS